MRNLVNRNYFKQFTKLAKNTIRNLNWFVNENQVMLSISDQLRKVEKNVFIGMGIFH